MSARSLAGPRGGLSIVLLMSAALGGCATFSQDGGFTDVQKATKERIGKDIAWSKTDAERQTVDARTAEILSKTLSADDAVQIALLNNRGLQASFYELGISEADFVQAGRLPNPGFSFSRLRRGDEVEYERGVHFMLARLFAMPLLRDIESRRFASVQQQVTIEALRLASETRKAYFTAIAAQQSLVYMRQVKDAADASAELGRRMAEVGNWSKLAQAREQSFYADATLNLARSDQAAIRAREQLTRLMGLWGPQIRFVLPDRLPDLPKAVRELPGIEQAAMNQRLDLAQMRLQTDSLARSLGLTRATRFINVLEVGFVRNTSNEEPTQRGYEISLEIPLFDWGGARVAKAEATYMQGVNRVAEAAINARSEVREAYNSYRIHYDITKHYRDEVVPIRKRISDENQLRYNGMLIGVFELLADARVQIMGVNGYIEALRDFWLADSDLQMSMMGRTSPGAALRAKQAAPDGGSGGH